MCIFMELLIHKTCCIRPLFKYKPKSEKKKLRVVHTKNYNYIKITTTITILASTPANDKVLLVLSERYRSGVCCFKCSSSLKCNGF